MGNIGFIFSDEAYYGFRLVGLNRCFLVDNLTAVRRAISVLKSDKSISLVLFEKKLKDALSLSEKEDIENSQQPMFFEVDTSGSKYYTDELMIIIKRLGVNINGS